MGVQHFHVKGPHPLLWNGSRAACGKRIICYVPGRVTGCVTFYSTYIIYESRHGPHNTTRWATGWVPWFNACSLSMNKPFSAILIIADRVLNWSKVYKTRRALSFRNNKTTTWFSRTALSLWRNWCVTCTIELHSLHYTQPSDMLSATKQWQHLFPLWSLSRLVIFAIFNMLLSLSVAYTHFLNFHFWNFSFSYSYTIRK